MLVIKGITVGTTLTFNNTIILITTKLGVPKLKFYFHYLKEIWVYLSEPNIKLPLGWAFFSYHEDTLWLYTSSKHGSGLGTRLL